MNEIGWHQKGVFQKSIEIILTIGLLLAGFAVRLYDLYDPPLDFHASRQLRSAIITRGFYWESLAAVDSTLADTADKATRLGALEIYEPPIMEWLVSRLNLILGVDVFWTGRIYSAFFWMIGGIFVWLICHKTGSKWGAWICLLFYLFLPFAIIAGRSFQPDPWMCAWCALTAWLTLKWAETRSWRWTIGMGLAGAAALLAKLFAGFFVGGMLVGTFFAVLERADWRKTLLQVFVAGVVMLLPAAIYFLLIHPSSSAGFFSFWVVSLSSLLRSGKFYAGWIAMIRGLFGFFLPILALLSALTADRKLRGLLIGWWVGYLIYGIVVPYQIGTHEYYSLILVPLIAISLAPLTGVLSDKLQSAGVAAQIGAVLVVVGAAGYGAYTACGTLRAAAYALEPPSWQRVGDALPEDSPFIALTSDYGMRLNYYGWKSPARTWPDAADSRLFALTGAQAEEFSSYFSAQVKGMDFFLITALGELEQQTDLQLVLKRVPVYAEGNGFIIYDLRESYE